LAAPQDVRPPDLAVPLDVHDRTARPGRNGARIARYDLGDLVGRGLVGHIRGRREPPGLADAPVESDLAEVELYEVAVGDQVSDRIRPAHAVHQTMPSTDTHPGAYSEYDQISPLGRTSRRVELYPSADDWAAAATHRVICSGSYPAGTWAILVPLMGRAQSKVPRM